MRIYNRGTALKGSQFKRLYCLLRRYMSPGSSAPGRFRQLVNLTVKEFQNNYSAPQNRVKGFQEP